MSVRSAQAITVEFITSSPTTQAAANADSTPTGTLVVNGTDNAASVTVTNVDTGRYKAAVTLPTLAVGDIVELSIAATVGAIAGKEVIWRDSKDVLLDSSGDVTFNNTSIATVTTATNLTNAPTAGDFTATMKTSITTAATAATPTVTTGTISTDAISASAVAAAAVTKIQSGLATPTNITAGVITTVTNLTNAPTSGDLTATMKTSVTTAATAATPTVTTGTISTDAVSAAAVSAAAVTKIQSGLSTYSGGAVASVTADVGITQAGADKVWGTASRTITGGTITTYTGDTPQTGDSYARIGAAGAGLTSLGDTRIAHLDADVSSRSTYAGGDTSGTTTLLARLTSTRAGLLDNLDAAISTRSTYAGGDTAGTTTLLARLTGPRATLLDNLDAAVSTRSTYAGGAVASVTAAVSVDSIATDVISAAAVSTAAVTKIQSGLSTYAGGDTSGTTTLLSRLSGTRAANLDNLDAAVSTRSVFAGGAVASVTGSVGSVVGNVGGSVGSVVAAVTAGTVSDKTGYKLALDGWDAIMIESGANARQTFAIMAAVLAGTATGVDVGSPVFKGIGVSTTRLSATASLGNRSSVVLTLP